MKPPPPRRRGRAVLSLSLLIIMSWGCTLLESIRWPRQDLMIIQQGLTIGLVPMWIPDHPHDASSLFYDWLFRRRRVYTLIRELHSSPANIVLYSELVSQSTGGVESEPQLLASPQQRPELWQVSELKNISSQAQQPQLSSRSWRVYSAVMSYLAENFLQDATLPLTLLWLRPAGAADPADPSPARAARAFPYASYAMAAGFTFNHEPLLVVLVHLLPAHRQHHQQVQQRLMDLLLQHPQYCPERIIMGGYLPAYGDEYTLNPPRPLPEATTPFTGPAQPGYPPEPAQVATPRDGDGNEATYKFLIPEGAKGQVISGQLWPSRTPGSLATLPEPLHQPLRLELSHLPSCSAPEQPQANSDTS